MAHGSVAVPHRGPVLPSQHLNGPAAHGTRLNQAVSGFLPGTCSGAQCWRPYGTSHTEDMTCGLSGPDGLGARSLALALPVHGMRLHIHHEVGSGDGLFGSYQRDKEPITVTPAEIIYQRRIAVLDHAARTGNVAETCRIFGISRTRYYQWKNVADRYGLDALVPKGRRTPQ